MQNIDDIDVYHMPMGDQAMGDNPWPFFEKARGFSSVSGAIDVSDITVDDVVVSHERLTAL